MIKTYAIYYAILKANLGRKDVIEAMIECYHSGEFLLPNVLLFEYLSRKKKSFDDIAADYKEYIEFLDKFAR